MFKCNILYITKYAPNFEEAEGAYCFWNICVCVCVCVRASITLFDE